MRKLLFFLLLTGSLSAQNRSIFFEHGNWSAMLDKAKKENKLIYLDCYTSWCGPCKWMAKNVFTNDTAADFYNEHFINVKIDMEKGEGIELAKRYGITAYPTMLYINAKGEQVHRTCGSCLTTTFVENGKNALDPLQQLAHFEQELKNGTPSASSIDHLLGLMESGCQEIDTTLNAYLDKKSEEELMNRENWDLIYKYTQRENNKAFHNLEKNKEQYSARYTADSVNNKISFIYKKEMNRAARLNDSARFEDLQRKVHALHIPEADKEAELSRINNFYYRGNWTSYADAAIRFNDTYPLKDPQLLNQFAWTFYEKVDKPEQLSKAEQWSKRSIELAPSEYAFQDTYAWVLYKLGKKADAKLAAEKAIQTAKLQKEDAEETKKLLKLLSK